MTGNMPAGFSFQKQLCVLAQVLSFEMLTQNKSTMRLKTGKQF
jgi:hypothetical protein